MAAQFQIRVEPDALIFRAVKEYTALEKVFACGVWGLVLGGHAFRVTSHSTSAVIGALGVLIGYAGTKWPVAAELRTTNLEFSTSRGPEIIGPTVSVPRADILYL